MVKKEKIRDLTHTAGTANARTAKKPLVVPAFVFERRNLSDTISLKNILLFCRESLQTIRDTDGKDDKSGNHFSECINRLAEKMKDYSKILDWDDKRVFHEMVEEGRKIESLLKSPQKADMQEQEENVSIRLYADIANFEWRVVRLLEQLRLATS